jgi:hypothetical protein
MVPSGEGTALGAGGGKALGAEGEEALTSEGWVKTRRHDNYTCKNKEGATLTWSPGPSSGPRSGTSAAVAAGAPGGDHPRWWWRDRRWWWRWWRWIRWWRWQRTDAPLRALRLGVGPLGPASCPLTLLGWVRNKGRVNDKRPIGATQPASPVFLRVPGATRGGGATCSLCPCPRGWGRGGSTRTRAGRLGTSRRCIGDLDPAVGVLAAGLADRHAALVEGRQPGQDRRPQPGSSKSAGMSWGGIRDSWMKDSPVIPFTRSSSSSQNRSVPGPRWIRPMSFGPVNQQHRRALLCSGAIQRFRKSLTTCIDVRTLVARVLILSSMGSNSSASDGLALHCFRSSLGPSLGSARRSLASVLAITQSAHQFSHLVPPREEM